MTRMGEWKQLGEQMRLSLGWNYGENGAGLSVTLAAAGTFFTGLVGGWDMMVRLLLLMMAVDYLSGMAAAWKEKRIDSKAAFWGGVNKVFVFCLVAVGVQLDQTLGLAEPYLRTAIIWFYVGREGLSILENVGKLGGKVPRILQEILVQLQERGDQGTKQAADPGALAVDRQTDAAINEKAGQAGPAGTAEAGKGGKR